MQPLSLQQLKARIDKLEKLVHSMPKGSKKPRKPRAPSAYNIFMKKEMSKIKKENPGIAHQSAFRKAAKAWKKQKG